MEQHEIQLLILSIDGSRFGIDIDQIAHMANFDACEAAVSFEQLLKIDASNGCGYSKMLMIKQMKTPVLIYEPDEVSTFSIGDINSLPDVLAIAAGEIGVWGLLPEEQGVIILIDFYKNQVFRKISEGDINN